MAEQPVVFSSGGQQVVGMWHDPVNPETTPAPAVVLLHGFTGHKGEAHRLFVEMARALAQVGIGALRFDFRGSGDSEGDFKDMTIMGEVADARAAVAFARSRPGVDSVRIGILGLSMGGTVAAFLAGEDSGLRAVTLWNPVAYPRRSAERRSTPETDRQMSEWGVVDYNGWAVGAALLKELPGLDPLSAIQQCAAPVYIVLGDQDTAVPNSDGLAFEQAVQSAKGRAQVDILTGADHTFAYLPHKQDAIQRTTQWLQRSLNA